MAHKTSPSRPAPHWAVLLIVAGTMLTILSAGGLLLLRFAPTSVTASYVPAPTRTPLPTPTLPRQAIVERQFIPITTPQPSPSPSPTPTSAPVTPIPWTQEEINALSWLCYYEVRGMAEARVDACLSVISTVRARYAYGSGFAETDVISTLRRPGQFNFDFDPSQPAPDAEMYWVVQQYQWGMRGSCNGFLYFDSVPGGPSLCVIQSSTGEFMEFHNGWR